MIIRDPQTGNGAEVNEEHELVVRAITEPELEHASGKLGTAFSWDSTELDIDAGDTMLFVKSTGDTPMICDEVEINGGNVVCTWEVSIGALTTTPAGTLITAVNQNETFATKAAEAIAYSDETALTTGSVIRRIKTGVSETKTINLTGVILGKNHYIQITQITESTSGSAVLVAHFENPS